MRCRRGRNKRIGSRALAGMVALASVFVLTAPDASAGRGGKADLVLKDAEQSGKPYSFRGERQNAKIKYEVKNTGRGNANTTATYVYFVGGGERIQGDGEALRGTIRPGRTSGGTIRQQLTDRPLPAGRYKLEVCVDEFDNEEEENERNNCDTVKNSRFYSTYRKWEGTLGGIAPAPGGSNRSWQTTPANPATYVFEGYEGGGTFVWKLVGGAIRHQTQGGSGCTYNGAGTFALATAGFGAGLITINHQTNSYSANAAPVQGAIYNVVVDCSGVKTNIPMPVGLAPALAAVNQDFPFGATALTGATEGSGLNFSWNLVGKGN